MASPGCWSAAAVVTPAGVATAHGPTSTVFPLASVTKPLTALATLVAVEEGAVDLGDPADEAIVPGATIRHLLAHASGLAPERPMRSFPPATRRVYSNVGINMIAALVERAVEMPFEAYLAEAVAKPLRLAATTLPGSAAAGGTSTVDELAGRFAGPLTFGVAICHEGWRYPETVRWAARRGAQIVFHPHFHEAEGGFVPTTFADPRNTFHEKAILCRAAENTCYVATVNCASAGSPTTSAVARPDGTVLTWQPYGVDGLLIADIHLDAATRLLASRCRY